jgi:hypothetical protein
MKVGICANLAPPKKLRHYNTLILQGSNNFSKQRKQRMNASNVAGIACVSRVAGSIDIKKEVASFETTSFASDMELGA